MDESARTRAINGRFAPKRGLTPWKERPSRTTGYVEFLAHFDAELRTTDGPVTVVRRKTGVELPLEEKGKLSMVRLLLDEFGTIDGVNDAIGSYLNTHS
jgi:hypothetical protein